MVLRMRARERNATLLRLKSFKTYDMLMMHAENVTSNFDLVRDYRQRTAEALPRRSLAHQLCAAPAAAAEEVENAGTNSPPPVHTSVKRCHEDAAPSAPTRPGKRAAGRGGVSCKSPSLDLSTPVIGVSSSLKARLELLHRLTA